MNATTKGNGEKKGFELAEKLATEGAAKTANGKSLPFEGDTIAVADGQVLTLTARQADGKSITSSGSGLDNGCVVIPGADATTPYDFSSITSESGTVTINIATGGVLDAGTSLDGMEVVVASGETLTLTAAQADGVTIRGDGNVVVTELGENLVDLSGIAVNGSQTAMVLGGNDYLYLDPNFDLGIFEVVVADGSDLSVTAAQANGTTIRSSGSGADNGHVHISDMDIEQAYDFSGITSGSGEVYTIIASSGTLNPDTKLGEMVLHVVYEADNTFTLTAKQADGRLIKCAEGIGHIQITDMDVATKYDFSGIDVSDASVSVVVTSGGTLEASTRLGAVEVVVADGQTLNLTAAQASSSTISGKGFADIVITGAAAATKYDFSTISSVSGTVTVNMVTGGLLDTNT